MSWVHCNNKMFLIYYEITKQNKLYPLDNLFRIPKTEYLFTSISIIRSENLENIKTYFLSVINEYIKSTHNPNVYHKWNLILIFFVVFYLQIYFIEILGSYKIVLNFSFILLIYWITSFIHTCSHLIYNNFSLKFCFFLKVLL